MNSLDNKIAILILFFNKLSETVSCIESFIPSQQPIYVLNNGSDPVLWKNLKKRFDNNKQVTFFHSDINLGVSIGRNYLIKKTTEPWLLIVDNDITIKDPSGWAKTFYSILGEQPTLEVFTLHIYNVHEKEYAKPINVIKKGRTISIEPSNEVVTNCFPGTGSIVNRNVFNKYGLFDESLFVGFEDYEYALRCIASPAGPLSVFHIAEIELVHDHKFQKTNIDKNAVKERYNEKRIKESYESIVSKYDIEFEHNWEWWTRNQVAAMNGQTFLGKIKNRIYRLISRP